MCVCVCVCVRLKQPREHGLVLDPAKKWKTTVTTIKYHLLGFTGGSGQVGLELRTASPLFNVDTWCLSTFQLAIF